MRTLSKPSMRAHKCTGSTLIQIIKWRVKENWAHQAVPKEKNEIRKMNLLEPSWRTSWQDNIMELENNHCHLAERSPQVPRVPHTTRATFLLEPVRLVVHGMCLPKAILTTTSNKETAKTWMNNGRSAAIKKDGWSNQIIKRRTRKARNNTTNQANFILYFMLLDIYYFL